MGREAGMDWSRISEVLDAWTLIMPGFGLSIVQETAYIRLPSRSAKRVGIPPPLQEAELYLGNPGFGLELLDKMALTR